MNLPILVLPEDIHIPLALKNYTALHSCNYSFSRFRNP